MEWHHGPEPEKLFETCLILGISPSISEYVQQVWAAPQFAAYARPKTQPHVTVLFVGTLPGEKLAVLERHLKDPPFAFDSLEAGLQGIGCFREANEVTNIHIRIETTPQLRAIHEWALTVCAAQQWHPSIQISGQNYVPHITVFTDLHEPFSIMEGFTRLQVPPRVQLSRMQMRAHPWQPQTRLLQLRLGF